MAESKGYYTYGDVKDFIINYNPSQGCYVISKNKFPMVSKNAISSLPSTIKTFDKCISTNITNKTIACHYDFEPKGANLHMAYIDNTGLSKQYETENISTNEYKVYTSDIGYYEITTYGQIARYNLNIIPSPSNATVIINGLEQTSYNGYETEEITYEVSCDGYKSRKRTFELVEDMTINVDLKAPTTLLRITTEPEDAIVIIDGEETHETYVVPGETITYQVYKDGYCFDNGDDVLTVEITPQDLEIEEYSHTLIQKFIQSASYSDDGITISGSGQSAFYNATYVSNAYSDGFNGVDNLTSGNYTRYPYSHKTASFLYFNFNSPKFIKTLTFSGAYYNSSNNSLVVRFYDTDDNEISELATTLIISDLFSSSARKKVTVNVNKIISKIRFYASATSSAGYVKILSFIKIT